MKLHDIKCWPEFYPDVASGRKPFEIRKNDRDYEVGDLLKIRWFDPKTKEFNGSVCLKTVTYLTGWEQKEGNVVLGIRGANLQEHLWVLAQEGSQP